MQTALAESGGGGLREDNFTHLSVYSGCVYLPQCTDDTGGQSGRDARESRDQMGPGSPPTGPYVRLVHDRVVYRRDVMRTPIRTLAAEIGISKSAADHFYKHRSPEKNWPKLRDWYMGQRERQLDDYQTPPEEILFSSLHTFVTVPKGMRGEVMRDVAESYRSIFLKHRLPVPDWVMLLTDTAQRELSSGPSDEPDLRVPSPPKPEH
ncbi:hypothetical protein [Longimicrobium sp.]|uniref:hypothetical protein n=1 Tax=Longimicrobium sp. TaxID=2029185 RepID=UPI002B75B857|nr:hypothetical protein [Longimicrobium sp.]HSU15647.1 hypothetical protein [Longimicrobium sp.]